MRRIPGIGWILAMARNIYIKRNWAEDVKIIDNMLDFYSSIKEEEAKQLVLFPEGTNINAKYNYPHNIHIKLNIRYNAEC